MTRRVLVAVVAAAFAGTAGAADGFKAGAAAAVITPAEFMWMAGYGARTKPAEGKLHDLHAKALALEDAGGKRLVLVTADLIGFSRSVADGIAADAAAKYGLKRDELCLNASHTHCGPVVDDNLMDMYPLTPEQGKQVTAYAKVLRAAVVGVIGEALKKLEPATLRTGKGTALFALNRREPTDKGVINGLNPNGPADHDVPVLVVDGADGKHRAILFGYACHNTTLAIQEWCGDYAGFAQLGVEAKFPGAVALFWIGCGADVNPQPRRTVELCRRHGKELADGVIAAVNGDLKPVTGRLAGRYAAIPLKLGTLPTKAQLSADTLSKNFALRRRAERLLKEWEAAGSIPDAYPAYPVQVWAVGDQLLWVHLGGEVVMDYALRLKKELPPGRTLWVAGYANDVMAYIPSVRVLKEGGYEADSSMIAYGLPTRWSDGVEDAIISKVKELSAAVSKPTR